MVEPAYDPYLAGFLAGKVAGLTRSFARRFFFLLFGGAALVLVVAGFVFGPDVVCQTMVQIVACYPVQVAGLATGIASGILLGPTLARRAKSGNSTSTSAGPNAVEK